MTFKIEKLVPPYKALDVRVLAEQEKFIDPTEKALSIMKDGEVPFLVSSEDGDVGFFTLRPSVNDDVEQLRGSDRCTLLSFMIDARHQGKGYARKARRHLSFIRLIRLNSPLILAYLNRTPLPFSLRIKPLGNVLE